MPRLQRKQDRNHPSCSEKNVQPEPMRKQQAGVGFVVTVRASKFTQLVTINVARFRAAAYWQRSCHQLHNQKIFSYIIGE